MHVLLGYLASGESTAFHAQAELQLLLSSGSTIPDGATIIKVLIISHVQNSLAFLLRQRSPPIASSDCIRTRMLRILSILVYLVYARILLVVASIRASIHARIDYLFCTCSSLLSRVLMPGVQEEGRNVASLSLLIAYENVNGGRFIRECIAGTFLPAALCLL